MHRHRVVLLGIAWLGLAPGVWAEDETTGLRDPSEMSVEERTVIMQRMNDYNGCVYKEAMARVEKLPDIRQAADEGMGACQGALDKLRETIEGYRFTPAFAEQFVHHAQNRVVKMLLPELSMRKGGQ